MQAVTETRDHRPLPERVYAALRDGIVDGELGPDRALVQDQIAAELGVSRTPVREALARLVQEGLVDRTPGGGFVVNDLTEADIVHVYEVRFALESLAIELSRGKYSAAQIARIRSLVEEMADDAGADASTHFELNRRFHLALMEPCGNPILMQTIYRLWDHPLNRRITKSYVSDPAMVERMVAEHRELLAAAEENDPRLVALAVEHMVAGYSQTLPDTLKAPPDVTPPPLRRS